MADDDFLGFGDSDQQDVSNYEFQGGESGHDAFEEFGDENEAAREDGAFGEDTLDGGYDTLQEMNDSNGGGQMMEETFTAAPTKVVEEEDGPLKVFERQWRADIEEKDAKDESVKNSMKEQAKQELEEFYESKKTTTTKKAAVNREQEQDIMNAINDALTAENPWERISTLVDTTGNNSELNERDVSRLRGILIQLKNAPLAQTNA